MSKTICWRGFACHWEREKFLDVFDLIDKMMRLPESMQAELEVQQQILDGRCEMAWKRLFEERAAEELERWCLAVLSARNIDDVF